MQTRSTILSVSFPMLSAACLAACLATPGCQAESQDETDSGSAENATSEPEQESESTPEFPEPPEGKVLRHAVFFSFKEESTEADITGVVDAFRQLPSKIEEIIDFEWGVNNSTEKLDDGFTHCFVLTFADEAGRSTYLPHPAHKDFGDVLRPHMQDVFVIDYWGNKARRALASPLRHAVFFRFTEDASDEEIAGVESAFEALPGKIEEIKDFEWGTNNSPEKHDDGFTHCFMVTFESEEARETYLPHADHMAFVEVLKPVLDAPRVLDFNAAR